MPYADMRHTQIAVAAATQNVSVCGRMRTYADVCGHEAYADRRGSSDAEPPPA